MHEAGRPRPRPGRVLLAFLLAPVAAATVVVSGMAAVQGLGTASWDQVSVVSLIQGALLVILFLFYAVPVAWLLALVAGVPLYLLLVKRVRFALRWTVAAGCGVTLPFLAVMAAVAVRVLLTDGEQVQDNLLAFAGFGALVLSGGAFGGVVFWLAAAWRDPRFAPSAPLD